LPIWAPSSTTAAGCMLDLFIAIKLDQMDFASFLS
jgi:hypothetical protein